MGLFDKLFSKKNKKKDVEITVVYGGPTMDYVTTRRPAEMKCVYASPQMMGGNYDSFNKGNYPFNYAVDNNTDNNVLNEVHAGPVYGGPIIPDKNETCRFCPFCAKPIPLDAQFCPICGANLKV